VSFCVPSTKGNEIGAWQPKTPSSNISESESYSLKLKTATTREIFSNAVQRVDGGNFPRVELM
jgi:hypothetical protein